MVGEVSIAAMVIGYSGVVKVLKKLLAVAVILLFISVSVIPSTGDRVSFDDTTPPNTTHVFDPSYPDGENSWYASDVEVTLIAIDDWSGVNATYYRLDGGLWMTYTEPFTVKSDGEHVIQYYSVDNAGNHEDVKSVGFKIDQTLPFIDVTWKNVGIFKVKFTADAFDATSGVDRVEFYLNDELMFTDYDDPYEWIWVSRKGVGVTRIGATVPTSPDFDFIVYDRAGWWTDYEYSTPHQISIKGLICNPEISEENVTFFALIIRCNIDGIHTFKHLSFPNNYEGYIGRFLIHATFNV